MLIALGTAALTNPESFLNISDLSRVHDAVALLMLTHHLQWSWYSGCWTTSPSHSGALFFTGDSPQFARTCLTHAFATWTLYPPPQRQTIEAPTILTLQHRPDETRLAPAAHSAGDTSEPDDHWPNSV